MEKIKTGIIGPGKVAHLHAGALLAAQSSQFTAVSHYKFEKARIFAEQYNVLPFESVKEMVRQAAVEAVIIATPHPAHAQPAIEAMEAGAHVIVEKPLASTLADCDTMIETSRRTGKKLAVISQRRLYPPVQRIREAIDDGKIGQPVLGTVNMLGWRDAAYYNADPWRGTWQAEGGGVLVNQSPHQLDILQWYMGDIDSIYGSWANLNHPYIEVEDTSAAIIRFKSGGIGAIVVSNSQNPALYGKVAVHGENGATVGVQTDGGAMFVAGMGMSEKIEAPYNDIWTVPGEESMQAHWKEEDAAFFTQVNPLEYFHQLQIQDFLESILNDRDPMITGEEGRKTVELFTGIYRSQRDGRPVQFPLTPEKDRDDMDGRISAQ